MILTTVFFIIGLTLFDNPSVYHSIYYGRLRELHCNVDPEVRMMASLAALEYFKPKDMFWEDFNTDEFTYCLKNKYIYKLSFFNTYKRIRTVDVLLE